MRITEEDTILSSKRCELIPLERRHVSDLIDSIEDGKLWTLWYTFIPKPEDMTSEIERRLNLKYTEKMIPFSIVEKTTGRVVGMTSLLNIDSANKRVEVGGTWIRKSCQGSGINLESKKLLLEYAFEDLGCNAVEFRTHFLNRQSRKGIEKLGAKLDGILRNHMIMPNGTLRDTCVYSIIKGEWATVHENLDYLINKTFRSIA